MQESCWSQEMLMIVVGSYCLIFLDYLYFWTSINLSRLLLYFFEIISFVECFSPSLYMYNCFSANNAYREPVMRTHDQLGFIGPERAYTRSAMNIPVPVNMFLSHTAQQQFNSQASLGKCFLSPDKLSNNMCYRIFCIVQY